MEFDIYGTLVVASLVLILGRKCVKHIELLKRYTIPEAVAGGLLVALLILLLRQTAQFEIKFDTTLQTPLMLMFFATIGLNANLKTLASGGKVLIPFFFVVIGLLILQNTVGVLVAKLVGVNPLLGLLAGSITLSGGHGTGSAWGATFTQEYGLVGASEVAIACATFGLVLGGIVGGPVARYLVKRTATPDGVPDDKIQPSSFEKPQDSRVVSSRSFIESIALIAICLSAGQYFSSLLNDYFQLPTFVCVLFTGVILSNILSFSGIYQVIERALSIIGNVSLSLFLAMALMSLKLWDIASLALPMLAILAAQTILMAVYAIFVTFRVMGKNYDAAVLAAGHCGFGLGATPTAIANMQAVTKKFGPSHMAFFIVPMVGAFLIDITNAIVIKGFLSLLT